MREKAALDQVLMKQSTFAASLDDKLKEYYALEKQWDSVSQVQVSHDLKLEVTILNQKDESKDSESFNSIIEKEIQVYILDLEC